MRALRSIIVPISLVSFIACDQSQAPFTGLKEAWNLENDPANFEHDQQAQVGDYIYRFDQLPLTGNVKETPWAGDYWPTHRGGISFRWNSSASVEESYSYDLLPFDQLSTIDIAELSPSEKYDLFMGDSGYSLTRFERHRTQILNTVPGHENYDPTFSIPTWEGLCHAWAPAALHFEYPGSLVMKGRLGHLIPFGSSDIQALLAMYVELGPTDQIRYIGDRCDVSFEKIDAAVAAGAMSEMERFELIHSANCRDSNAGSFHLALANDLGRLGKGFVIDITRDAEVWNHPVHSFESRLLDWSAEASRGSAPGTVEELTLETILYYVGAGEYSFEGESSQDYIKSLTYRYRLELDDQGRILGGTWLTKDRPDFLWRMSIPEFTGPLQGLEEIYKASIAR